jgi:hypothetical protein
LGIFNRARQLFKLAKSSGLATEQQDGCQLKVDCRLPSLALRASCCLLIVLGACSGNIRPPSTVPVRGVVKYKRKPAAGIRVKFHPQFNMGSIKFIPLGETGADGSFTLSTGAPGNGAPRGSYVVTFEKPEIAPAAKTNYIETEIDALHGKYSDPQKSKLQITIASGENSLQPFEIE